MAERRTGVFRRSLFRLAGLGLGAAILPVHPPLAVSIPVDGVLTLPSTSLPNGTTIWISNRGNSTLTILLPGQLEAQVREGAAIEKVQVEANEVLTLPASSRFEPWVGPGHCPFVGSAEAFFEPLFGCGRSCP